jgi:thiamine-monophosphate kinase
MPRRAIFEKKTFRRDRAFGELSILRKIRARENAKSFAGLVLGIGDDCALLQQKSNEQIAVTTDLSIEGRHFRLEWHPPEVVGYRTLARGLSDLAAMGARPLGAFLSLGLPRNLTRSKGREASWLDRFVDGFSSLAEAHATPLAGGDLAESAFVIADIVLIGAVPRGRALLRSGANAGDSLYVTGTLGGSAAGLSRLSQIKRRVKSKEFSAQLAAHFSPEPRLAQGWWLQRRGIASAAIDLSDGLSTDLAHLCEESSVRAELDAASLPIAPGATFMQALHGGEDYELLFTAPQNAHLPRTIAGVPVTKIGRMMRRRAGQPLMTLRNETSAQPLEPRGWQHFIEQAGALRLMPFD